MKGSLMSKNGTLEERIARVLDDRTRHPDDQLILIMDEIEGHFGSPLDRIVVSPTATQ